MTINELKTGMRVILRNGAMCTVLRDTYLGFDMLCDVDDNTILRLDRDYQDDMTCKPFREFDIMQVVAPHRGRNGFVLWNRAYSAEHKKVRKVTMEELREVYGCDVEILGV